MMSNETEDLYLVLAKASGDNPDYLFVEVERADGTSVQIKTGPWESRNGFAFIPFKGVVQGE